MLWSLKFFNSALVAQIFRESCCVLHGVLVCCALRILEQHARTITLSKFCFVEKIFNDGILFFPEPKFVYLMQDALSIDFQIVLGRPSLKGTVL